MHLKKNIFFYYFSVTCLFSILLFFLQKLPNVLTFDSQLYIDLSSVIFSDEFPERWDFIRTPIYPILLKVAFLFFGKNSLAISFLNSTLLFLGTILLSRIILAKSNYFYTGIFILATSFCPLLVLYTHVGLTELGTFFFLSICSYFAYFYTHNIKQIFIFAIIVALAYYYRPTIYYYILFYMPFIYLVKTNFFQKKYAFSAKALKYAFIFAVTLLIFIYPWKNETKKSGRVKDMYSISVAKQGILPSYDPLIKPIEAKYIDAENNSFDAGGLTCQGIKGTIIFMLGSHIKKYAARKNINNVLLYAIKKYPFRYIKSVACTMLSLTYLSPEDGQVRLFTQMVLDNKEGHSIVLSGPENLKTDIKKHFQEKVDKLSTRSIFIIKQITYLYEQLIGSMFIFLPLVFIYSLLYREKIIFLLSGSILMLLALHSLILIPINRYMLPVYPFLIGTYISFIHTFLKNHFVAKKSI